MKQLLFLLFLPCLALAQYPGNANQKITLGEQTTADGLIFRGVASIDTVTATSKITRANKQDTSAFLLLDTVTNLLWHYKTASNGWIQAGGGVSVSSFSAGTTGLTPSTATTGAVTLGGTLAVANGGTNAGAFTAGSVVFAGTSGTYTQDNSGFFWDNTNKRLGLGTTSPTQKLYVNGNGYINGNLTVSNPSTTNILNFNSASNSYQSNIYWQEGGVNKFEFGKASTTPNLYFYNYNTSTYSMIWRYTDDKVQVASLSGTGSRAVNADADGVLSAASDSRLKKQDYEHEIEGLNEIMQLKPVAYKWLNDIKNRGDQAMTEIGFFADDVAQIIPSAAPLGNDGYYGFYDRAILAALVKAMQEQQAQIEQLKQRILNLENK